MPIILPVGLVHEAPPLFTVTNYHIFENIVRNSKKYRVFSFAADALQPHFTNL